MEDYITGKNVTVGIVDNSRQNVSLITAEDGIVGHAVA
jgi:hypothetical protein